MFGKELYSIFLYSRKRNYLIYLKISFLRKGGWGWAAMRTLMKKDETQSQIMNRDPSFKSKLNLETNKQKQIKIFSRLHTFFNRKKMKKLQSSDNITRQSVSIII